MIFFRLFESQKIMKICSKTHQIAQLNFFFRDACSRTPLANASPPPPPNNSWPPLANPAYAHKLQLRNVFENPPWQTVVCV